MNILTLEALRARGVVYSRTHLSRLIEAGQFPKPVRFPGAGPRARLFWREAEINAWIKAMQVARKEQQPA